jgi:hypothetical protein
MSQNNMQIFVEKVDDAFLKSSKSYKGYVKDKNGDLYFHNGNGYFKVEGDEKVYENARQQV